MLLNGYLGQLGRTLDCGNRDATEGREGWLCFFSIILRKKEAWPHLCFFSLLPPQRETTLQPCSRMPKAFPLAFVVYFAGGKKKKKRGWEG